MVRDLLKRGKPLGQRCFVAAFYLLASGVVYAQSVEEIQAIKKQTEIKSLNQLQKTIKKNSLSSSKLQKMAKDRNIPFKGEFEGKLFQIKSFDQKTGFPNYYTTFNADAGKGLGVDKVHSTGGVFNLDGQGIIVHEWDGGGVLTTHDEFGGRVIQKDTPNATNDHATHVAGTMIASGANVSAKGMLPKATLHAYEWTNDLAESIDAAINGAIISNHSYGNLGGFEYGQFSGRPAWHWFGRDEDTEYVNYGRYDLEDAQWDMIMRNAPYYLPVRAAGNPRGNGPEGTAHYVRKVENGVPAWVLSNKVRQKNGGEFGYDTLVNGTNGKNILIVGAARKMSNGYENASSVVPASFSAFGPTDDGRIKPDLMGIGVNIFSTLNTDNRAYDVMSGTSMAAPGVTAALGLFQQHYKNLYGAGKANPFMKAPTLRALAIHTASEAGEHPGPDYGMGWGLLNTYKAIQTISTKEKYSLIEEKTLSNGATQTFDVVAQGNEPLVVTIAWNDPAPIVATDYTLNDRTPRLVNDLDLRVSDGTTTFSPWLLDPNNPRNAAIKGDNKVDNVEQVLIESPVKGKTYTITINHKGTLKTNQITNNQITLVDATEQDFSMVVTGINKGITKDARVISVNLPASRDFSSQTPATVKIENIGSQSITGAKLKYELVNTDNNNQVVSTQEVALDEIPVGATIDKVVEIDLSTSFVNYAVTAEIVWAEDEISDNNKASAKAFGLIANLTTPNTRYDYSFETGFEPNGWTTQDVDANNDTWGILSVADYARTGISQALNFPGFSGKGTDDWLFSNPMRLKANTEYRVVINTRNDNTSNPDDSEPLEVHFGKDPVNTSMTKIGETIEVKAGVGYIHKVYTFTPTEDGLYHIGFHHKRDEAEEPYGVVLDDISVQYADSVPMPEFVASKVTPNTVEGVTLTPEVETPNNDPITAYQWIFEPNTVKFLENTTATSAKPVVSFNEEVPYNVTLKATNSKGEGSFTKKQYIKPVNVPVHTSFYAEQIYIYQGETVRFTNITIGNPMPDQWKWTITPSEGLEFLENTSDTSELPVVKFTKPGKYTVKLKATSPINSTDEETREDLIEVRPVYNEVRNLTHTFDKDKKVIHLNWEQPYRLPVYSEGFETTEINEVPTDFHQIDEDGDFRRWRNTLENTYKGKRVIASLANNRAADTRNWLITGKITKGAEELRFWRASYLPQGLEVYLVPATGIAGTHPTVDEINANGKKLYDVTSTGQSFRERVKYSQEIVDLSAHSMNDDFFLAILHKKKKEDVPIASTIAHLQYVDEIEVAYKDPLGKTFNSVKNSAPKTTETKVELSAKEQLYGKFNTKAKEFKIEPLSIENDIKPMAVLPFAKLSGYEIVKNGSVVKTTNDINDKTFSEIINRTGTYDVYAVYSDGVKSEKNSVTIGVENLPELPSQYKVYPNPSNGIFNVEMLVQTTSTSVSVYDMSGKLILTNQQKGNKVTVDLTGYAKGVYVLKIVDNRNREYTTQIAVQ